MVIGWLYTVWWGSSGRVGAHYDKWNTRAYVGQKYEFILKRYAFFVDFRKF